MYICIYVCIVDPTVMDIAQYMTLNNIRCIPGSFVHTVAVFELEVYCVAVMIEVVSLDQLETKGMS